MVVSFLFVFFSPWRETKRVLRFTRRKSRRTNRSRDFKSPFRWLRRDSTRVISLLLALLFLFYPISPLCFFFSFSFPLFFPFHSPGFSALKWNESTEDSVWSDYAHGNIRGNEDPVG